MSATLLHIHELSVAFKNQLGLVPALNRISLEVNKGEILAVVGESGSGKSITSLSVMGLLSSPPAIFTNGSINFMAGEHFIDVLKSSKSVLQSLRGHRMAMIFQEPMTSLNPVLTCGFQVMEALQTHFGIGNKEAKARTIELFEKVKLPEPEKIFKRYPHQISGGQKQRVMIAMAISCDPDLLICDEPTTALDVTVQKEVLQLIRSLQIEKNMGVIFITHDLGVVAEIADRVLVLYKGSIAEENSTSAIFNHPEHPYTRALLACRPALHPKGKRLPVVSDFINNVGETYHAANRIVDDKPVSPKIIAATALPEKNCLLSVKNLSVRFPAAKSILGKPLSYTKAVDDISFEVYAGETLGLVGESGCGKTTLGRTLLQLMPASSGEIIYKGIDLVNAAPDTMKRLRKEMQIIFQDPYSSLNPRMSIGEAIAEPMLVHHLVKSKKEAEEQVIDLLEKVQLKPEHFNRYPHEFSGGQRQRIVIARALAVKPSFIICDESVSALDVSVQAQVLNLLNDLKASFGFTAVFISHDLSVVRYISDRIMVMQKGKIIESGDAEAIYQNPREAYTRQLIDAIPGGIMA